jgi:hypothetical protein
MALRIVVGRRLRKQVRMSTMATTLPTLPGQRRESHNYCHWSMKRHPVREQRRPSSNLSETPAALPLVRCFHHHHFSRRETGRSLFCIGAARDGPCVEKDRFCHRKCNSRYFVGPNNSMTNERLRSYGGSMPTRSALMQGPWLE